MDSISLNKENGQKLWANDWNKLVSTINQIIEVVNTLGDNPAITKLSQLTNDSGFVTALDLAKVASTGNYNDLSNKPQNQQGDSAYQVAVNNGFTGTEQEWLTSLKGDTGQDGSNGQDGVPGQDGNDGLSAYQLAVQEGYDGTLQQWLASLHGQDGQNGSNGTDGITPHIDQTTGNWFIGTTNTGVQAQGPAGQNGSNGTNGSNGQDGVTPHIDSTTGNWFIGETNTGVSAQGPAGSDGSNGINGSNGTDGITPIVTVTTISNGHNVAFNYGSGDSRNTNFDIIDGNVANQLQADWNQTDNTQADYIKNKPTIPSESDLTNYVQKSQTVGLIKNDGTIINTSKFLQPINNNGHAYVDLGLPSGTLWATMNIGASSEVGYGNYYMYGKGTTQYNSSDTMYTGEENPLNVLFDTARQEWGGDWHLPTKSQCEELLSNTTKERILAEGGVQGVKFTATNGNYIFLPYSGYYSSGTENLTDFQHYFIYLTSTPDEEHTSDCYHLKSNVSLSWYGVNTTSKAIGGSARGVLDSSSNIVDMSNYIQKNSTSGLIKNDGTIDTNTYLTSHQDISGKANSSDLATVATTGSYNDLLNKPTIPSTTGMVTSSTTGLKIEVVASLPASPDSNTIYIVQ